MGLRWGSIGVILISKKRHGRGGLRADGVPQRRVCSGQGLLHHRLSHQFRPLVPNKNLATANAELFQFRATVCDVQSDARRDYYPQTFFMSIRKAAQNLETQNRIHFKVWVGIFSYFMCVSAEFKTRYI